VLHYNGPVESLRVTPYPDAGAKFPGAMYYLKGFLSRSALITYRPRAVFYHSGT
jgi:hypothetical protein